MNLAEAQAAKVKLEQDIAAILAISAEKPEHLRPALAQYVLLRG